MKKALLLGLSLSLALSLIACNGSNDNAADHSQDPSTPAVTEPVDASAPEVTQPADASAPAPEQTPQTTPEAPPETTPDTAPQPQEETPVVEETGPKFTEVNETVYATTSVNVRASYSADSDKVGGLSAGASATRTGIGDNGWSRIVYGDSVAYVNSSYLTTTKPDTSGNPDPGSEQTSKPATNPSTGTSTEKPNTNTEKPNTNPETQGNQNDQNSSGSSGELAGWDSPEDKQEWIDKVNGSGDGTYYDEEWGIIIPGL